MTRAGIARDVMTFWIRNGVLHPTEKPSGTGQRLQFRWYEANIAAVMNQFRILGVKVEGMVSIGNAFRDSIAWFKQQEISDAEAFALKNLRLLNQLYELHKDDRALEAQIEKVSRVGNAIRVTDRVKELYATIPTDVFSNHFDRSSTILSRPTGEPLPESSGAHLTLFWRVGRGDEYRFDWGMNASVKAQADGAYAMIAVDIDSIIHSVWNCTAAGDPPPPPPQRKDS